MKIASTGSEGGGWKSTGNGNSPAPYPTTGEAQATPNASGQTASTCSGRKARTGKRAG
ncbi:hypothetical protein [Ktedonobacter sp. SOSP1-52]|uniref:hypothetical protein n=1 Tax=Ktedonobacter sp. SOSP1-52 TaxID=2778366 RepID=UPI0019150304|nr:hypothetical protein [Ktedonobacter sp. SOSP1-52]